MGDRDHPIGAPLRPFEPALYRPALDRPHRTTAQPDKTTRSDLHAQMNAQQTTTRTGHRRQITAGTSRYPRWKSEDSQAATRTRDQHLCPVRMDSRCAELHTNRRRVEPFSIRRNYGSSVVIGVGCGNPRRSLRAWVSTTLPTPSGVRRISVVTAGTGDHDSFRAAGGIRGTRSGHAAWLPGRPSARPPRPRHGRRHPSPAHARDQPAAHRRHR